MIGTTIVRKEDGVAENDAEDLEIGMAIGKAAYWDSFEVRRGMGAPLCRIFDKNELDVLTNGEAGTVRQGLRPIDGDEITVSMSITFITDCGWCCNAPKEARIRVFISSKDIYRVLIKVTTTWLE